MKLSNFCNERYNYELEKLCRLFLPFEKIEVIKEEADDDICGLVKWVNGREEKQAKARLCAYGKTAEYTAEIENPQDKREIETTVCFALYKCFCEIFGYNIEWGILTGIRPAKLFSSLCGSLGEEKAIKYFKEKFGVSDEKIELCTATAKGERDIIEKSTRDAFSLYISIPFCPSRCSYCSFVSHAVDKAQKLIPEYLEKLSEELRITAQIARRNGLTLKTIYIGGGTPTTLSATQLDFLLETVKLNFDTENLLEYTLEAGGPDTITEEKLRVIKKYGITRISVNPQTMNDNVLQVIGRKHTAKQTEEAFFTARKVGFDNINMDLIAGLPEDTPESFANTLDRVIELDPESVTVHSLSMKRASFLTKKGELPDNKTGADAAAMVSTAYNKLSNAGILPYYMYRQSKTVGNLE
ncbi:MAG: coproporphyrinogen dehydrogenase HemZ, partial [Clostridiales bacterium]|nr:coproporphyrinogen dehydrogenase HemZ [Candidatus Equinaster intestinalis]